MKLFVKTIFLLFFLNSFGQRLDSISYKPTHFFEDIYKQYQNYPISISELNIDDFTTSSIYYKGNRKDFKLGQEPEAVRNFVINTNGIYKSHKDVIFFGDFTMTKQFVDNLKWNLSYMDVDGNGQMPEPDYYAVSKGSKWNNQIYDLRGGINFPINNRWRATVYANYYLKEKFRSEYDPRPNIKQNTLDFFGGLSYSINCNHNISVEFLRGYSNILNKISYSDRFTNTPYYVDKYLRWIFGYGTMYLESSSSTEKYQENKGFSLSYHYQNKDIKWLNYLRFKVQKTDTYDLYEKDRVKMREMRVTYSKSNFLFNSNLIKQLSKDKILSINTSIEKQLGSNFLIIQSGKNYEANSWVSLFSVFLSRWGQQKRYSQIGLIMSFEAHNQKDKLVQTELNNRFIQTEIQYEKEFSLTDKWYILPNFILGYKKVLDTRLRNGKYDYIENLAPLDFSGQALRLFYKEVVYNDYEYLKQNSFKIHYGLKFQQKRGKMRTLISFSQTNYFLKNKVNWFTGLSLTLQY